LSYLLLTKPQYEVELLQRLTHENIVHILGKAESDKHLYLFMEYVFYCFSSTLPFIDILLLRYMENGSMRGLLQSFGAFPEQLVAQFMEQVLKGLIYLHEAGVVHRDIKAANSMYFFKSVFLHFNFLLISFFFPFSSLFLPLYHLPHSLHDLFTPWLLHPSTPRSPFSSPHHSHIHPHSHSHFSYPHSTHTPYTSLLILPIF
jgi:Protein kinase domain